MLILHHPLLRHPSRINYIIDKFLLLLPDKITEMQETRIPHEHSRWHIIHHITLSKAQFRRFLLPTYVEAITTDIVHGCFEAEFETAAVLCGGDDEASAVTANLDPHTGFD